MAQQPAAPRPRSRRGRPWQGRDAHRVPASPYEQARERRPRRGRPQGQRPLRGRGAQAVEPGRALRGQRDTRSSPGLFQSAPPPAAAGAGLLRHHRRLHRCAGPRPRHRARCRLPPQRGGSGRARPVRPGGEPVHPAVHQDPPWRLPGLSALPVRLRARCGCRRPSARQRGKAVQAAHAARCRGDQGP